MTYLTLIQQRFSKLAISKQCDLGDTPCSL